MKGKLFSLLFILICLLHLNATAQNEVTGRVKSSKGKAIAGVSVYIEDLKIGAQTDDNGVYTIANLPAGTINLTVRALGYETLIQTVKVKGLVNADITLKATPYEADEIVVTGTAKATSLNAVSQPITEVSHEYLIQNASTNIIDALAEVPGVSGITDGQSISKPVIRGMGYNRVLTIHDGVRQEGQQWGDEFGIEIDANSVDRIEVLKGPASLVYGSDALAGVINMLPEKTLPEGQVKGYILYNYQTNNGLMNTAAHLAGTKKGISFGLSINNTMAHAYQNKYDGYVFNSQFSNLNWDATLSIHRKWGYSQLRYSYFNLKTGIVEGERDSTGAFMKQSVDDLGNPIAVRATNQELKSYTPFVINQNVTHEKLVWDNSIALGKNTLKAIFAFQQNSRQENNDITIPNTSNIYYQLTTLNYDLRFLSPIDASSSFAVGVNGMNQNSSNKGTLLLIPEYNLFDLGAFAIYNKQMGKINFNAGVRYDSRKFKGNEDYTDSNGVQLHATDPNAILAFSAYNSNFNGVSGSVGATYKFNNHVYLKANVGRGFRAPNVAESGSNGIHDGTVVYEIGQHDLAPESSLQIDITPGIRNKNFSAELSLFSNSISNYIFPKQLKTADGSADSLRSVPGFPDAPVFLYTQGNASFTGAEFALDIHPVGIKWFDWYTTYSTVDAHLTGVPDSEKYLPFTPPALLKSDISIKMPKIGKGITNAYIRLGVFYSFEQSNIYNASSIYAALSGPEYDASRKATPAYTLLNAAIGGDIMRHGKKLCSVYLNANNITDEAYIDYMSRFKYYPANLGNGLSRVGVYNMGRNFSIKMLIPLDFSKTAEKVQVLEMGEGE